MWPSCHLEALCFWGLVVGQAGGKLCTPSSLLVASVNEKAGGS